MKITAATLTWLAVANAAGQNIIVSDKDKAEIDSVISLNEALAKHLGNVSYDFEINMAEWSSDYEPWSDSAVGSELVLANGDRRLEVQRTQPFQLQGSSKRGFHRALLRAVCNADYSASYVSPSTGPCEVYEHLAVTAPSAAEEAVVLEGAFATPLHRLVFTDNGRPLKDTIWDVLKGPDARLEVLRPNDATVRVKKSIAASGIVVGEWDFDMSKGGALCGARHYYGFSNVEPSMTFTAKFADASGNGDWFPVAVEMAQKVMSNIASNKHQLIPLWSRVSIIKNVRIRVPISGEDILIKVLNLPEACRISWWKLNGTHENYYAQAGTPIPEDEAERCGLTAKYAQLLVRLNHEQAKSKVQPTLLQAINANQTPSALQASTRDSSAEPIVPVVSSTSDKQPLAISFGHFWFRQWISLLLVLIVLLSIMTYRRAHFRRS